MRRKNIVWHPGVATSGDRQRLMGQKGCVAWLTGLSGSGKSTLACGCEAILLDRGRAAFVLDGDNLRHGLNKDLGFSPCDRKENIRRVAHVASLFADAGLIVITSFISPYRRDRAAARDIIGAGRFMEVYLDVPLSVCEKRDPKKLYRRARAGEVAQFTGVSAPYEPPEQPDLTVRTAESDIETCVAAVTDFILKKALILTD